MGLVLKKGICVVAPGGYVTSPRRFEHKYLLNKGFKCSHNVED